LFARTPSTHGPCIVSSTADGPSPQVSVEPTLDEVAGNVSAGPMPQISAPGFAGDRNAVKLTLPSPKLVSPLVKLGCHTSGKIVRVMTFQSFETWSGMTG